MSSVFAAATFALVGAQPGNPATLPSTRAAEATVRTAEAATRAATPSATRPGIARPPVVKSKYIAKRDIAYGPATGSANLLDIYLPEGAEEVSAPLPLVIWIHGGGWTAGDKRLAPAEFMTAAGYACASINYRFSQEAPFPAQIYDCKAAVRFLRANAAKYNLDPARIVVAGDSAGGHLAALLGTTGGNKALEGDIGGNLEQAGPVQGVIDFYGPADFNTMREDFLAQYPGQDFPLAQNLVTKLFGGKDDLALLTSASPVAAVSAGDPPFLILHGDKDPLVPLRQSQHLLDALTKAGVESKLIVIPNGGHGGPAFFSPPNLLTMGAFLQKHIGAGIKAEATSRPAAK